MRVVTSVWRLSGILAAVGILSAPCWARLPPLSRYQYTQLHMGVQVRIVVYAPDKAAAEGACTAAFARFAELEDTMSDYRPTSELMRLCAQAGGRRCLSVPIFSASRERAHEAARSGGAFDVTVGPYVALWRQTRKSERCLRGANCAARARWSAGSGFDLTRRSEPRSCLCRICASTWAVSPRATRATRRTPF